jgi:hypothetical protein
MPHYLTLIEDSHNITAWRPHDFAPHCVERHGNVSCLAEVTLQLPADAAYVLACTFIFDGVHLFVHAHTPIMMDNSPLWLVMLNTISFHALHTQLLMSRLHCLVPLPKHPFRSQPL